MTAGVRDTADRWLMPNYRRQPVTFVRGEGMYLYDEPGRPYLDFVAGIAVNALGHAHPAVLEAIAEQAGRVMHVSNFYYTEPMARLAERLCGLLGFGDGKVFFTNSGAEAVECSIKLARKWAKARFGPGRHETVAAEGSFHGRTMGALSATGQPAKQAPFEPLVPGFVHAPFGDAPALEAALSERSCSVLLEPVQGEAGVIVPPADYLPAVRAICDGNQLVFIADEVQTGVGRTGRWFAFQHSGAAPDVVTVAKALGGGVPIGACIARGEAAVAFEPGDHASTMGGNPLACSAALAVLDVIESEKLVPAAERTGARLKHLLEVLAGKYPLIREVRGSGLLIAVELCEPAAGAVVAGALGKGLLVNEVTPSAIRLCPPLIVSDAQCGEAVEILDRVFGMMEAK
ncbi:MAG: acetylornithine transaminase [Actinomycetota bacterium]